MDDRQPLRSYETALQAIGAYLDARCATEFKLLETPRGFAVRFAGRGSQQEFQSAFFRFADLHSSGIEIDVFHKLRHTLGPEDRQYRHLLGAIGHDLDEARAVSILIDELPDSFLITYEFDDPRRGYVLRKRMAIAGPKDRERLLHDAHHRRTRLKPRRMAEWRPVSDSEAFQ
jgi:hypothetical protein